MPCDRRRKRQRQDGGGPLDPAPDPVAARQDHRRPDLLQGHRPPHVERRRLAEDPRPHDRDRLPGSHDLAQPGHEDRPADHRGAELSRGADPKAGARPCDRDFAQGRHSQAGGTPGRLPAPVLGWHAPACDDRHGAVLLARTDRRGRTDHRARRDDPGADRGADQAPAGGARAPRSSGSRTIWASSLASPTTSR